MNEKTGNIRMEMDYKASISDVWKALTDQESMKEWYFDIPDFKAEEGAEFTFRGEAEGREYIHLCKVIEVIPEEKISYTWRYKDYKGESKIVFSLKPIGPDQTKLIFSHEGLESFPRENRDLSVENFVQGWKFLLESSLKGFLESQ